jgi:hypothetical protein
MYTHIASFFFLTEKEYNIHNNFNNYIYNILSIIYFLQA